MNPSVWRNRLKPYAQPSLWRSIFQMVNTALVYVVLLLLMAGLLKLGVHPLWVIPLAIPTGAMMVRTFILFHDCTHLSFFKSKRANAFWGYIFGVLTFTPYTIWQSEHNRHHGTVGNLDLRGVGDVWTMTVNEYQASSKWKQFIYRLYRNPVFLFFIAPFFLFGVINRFPAHRNMKKEEHYSLIFTNLGILGIAIGASYWIGFLNYLAIQLPVLFVASVMGVWLFFVQHQFEDVYWEKDSNWDFVKAALEGSSFYKLPLVLEWVSGYIGYHHIHHLNPRIPNYNLKRCYKDVVEFGKPHTVTLMESFKLALLHLYDEQTGKLVKFGVLKRRGFSN